MPTAGIWGLWHDPHHRAPRWELPSVFDVYPDVGRNNPYDYYRAYPELSDFYSREPVHPQITLENAPDSVHFRYVHDAGSDQVLEHWKATGNEYRTTAGWPNPKSNAPERYQIYLETPACAQRDARPYGALRKWARQFYEIEPVA